MTCVLALPIMRFENQRLPTKDKMPRAWKAKQIHRPRRCYDFDSSDSDRYDSIVSIRDPPPYSGHIVREWQAKPVADCPLRFL